MDSFKFLAFLSQSPRFAFPYFIFQFKLHLSMLILFKFLNFNIHQINQKFHNPFCHIILIYQLFLYLLIQLKSRNLRLKFFSLHSNFKFSSYFNFNPYNYSIIHFVIFPIFLFYSLIIYTMFQNSLFLILNYNFLIDKKIFIF